ncbi:hypothetical protein ASF61_10285 [Duganella sp. Leaf126]|uniref:hypothetical protein n=1 Tax=Duganella sp. Leaf126 TaxID=1736266 RepID=UPI0006F8AEBF|nr:hypothetical protein [Duganella sp. Leaf126]KQQ33459.1 hypothetical protein ASF61_10285 [Duganella sp. Leaf126]
MPTIYLRTLLARSHSATLRTRLLISRCRQGSLPGQAATAPPADRAAPRSAQANWYAKQQREFLNWLDDGGMTQEVQAAAQPAAATIGNSGKAPLFPAPCTDADEELQFSQVRIRDAVR